MTDRPQPDDTTAPPKPGGILTLHTQTYRRDLLSRGATAAETDPWLTEVTDIFAVLRELCGTPLENPGSAPSPAGHTGHSPVLRLDLDALRRRLRKTATQSEIALTENLIARLLRLPGAERTETVRLPLTPDELYALHALLLAAYHDPGSGAFVGPTLRDWRDHLDSLHRKAIALVERTDTRQPETPPGP